MKTLAILLCLIAVCAARPHHHDYRATRAIQGVFHKFSTFFNKLPVDPMSESKHRVRRQNINPSCLADIAQSQSQKFTYCSSVITQIADLDSLNLTVIDKFCHDDCPNFMIGLLKRVVVDCGLNDSLPDINEQTLVLQTCQRSTDAHYCVEEWSYFNPDATDLPLPLEYTRCLTESDGTQCPDDCKSAETWILNHIGCCYRSLLDFIHDIGATGVALDEPYWDACRKKEPGLCSS